MSYYYFVASLPTLELGAPAPTSVSAYGDEVRRLLPAEVSAEYHALLGGEGAAARSSFAARWRDSEAQLRNTVARTRATRRNVEVAPYLRPQSAFSVFLDQAVADAYSKPHPLERELALDRFRWNFLDELVRTSPFGLEAVLAYGLKLRMVERWQGLKDDAGRAALLQAVNDVREIAATSAGNGRPG